MIGTDLSQYRQHFPVTQQLIYLNHAAVAPLAGPVAEAMARLADDVLHSGSFHSSEWRKTYDGLRAAAARLIHAEPGEIALMKNTSEGIATIAMGLDWRAGDRIIAFEEEFPANQYPWRRLEAKGVRIEWLRASDPLDRIDAAASGARLRPIFDWVPLEPECDRRNLPPAGRNISSRCDPGIRRVPGGRSRGPYRCAGGRWPQVAGGAGGLRHPLHFARASGPCGAGGVRLDERGRL